MKISHKIILSLTIIKIIFIDLATGQSCPTQSQCMHGGAVNTAACKCDCYPAYSG